MMPTTTAMLSTPRAQWVDPMTSPRASTCGQFFAIVRLKLTEGAGGGAEGFGADPEQQQRLRTARAELVSLLLARDNTTCFGQSSRWRMRRTRSAWTSWPAKSGCSAMSWSAGTSSMRRRLTKSKKGRMQKVMARHSDARVAELEAAAPATWRRPRWRISRPDSNSGLERHMAEHKALIEQVYLKKSSAARQTDRGCRV